MQSPNNQVSLLELYTSEGCSSCPPADRWLSQLKDDPRLWRHVVPIAFHVDYWDYIGWPDRFASPVFSNRQRGYAAQRLVSTVYTPGLILNGEEWRSWFRKPSLELRQGPQVGILTINVNQKQVMASFAASTQPSEQLEIHLAILGFDLSTAVKAGENRGRELTHDFVVLGYDSHDLTLENGRYVADFELPKARFEVPRKGLAAWVSKRNDPRPLQAVGSWF